MKKQRGHFDFTALYWVAVGVGSIVMTMGGFAVYFGIAGLAR